MKTVNSKSYLECLDLSTAEQEALILAFSEAPEEMKEDLIEDYCRECFLYGRKWSIEDLTAELAEAMKKKLLEMPLERWTLNAKSLSVKAVFHCSALKANLYMTFPDKRARLTRRWRELQDESLYSLFLWAKTDDSFDWNDVEIKIKGYE